MKIEHIKFQDWRCFRGEQKIVFSTDSSKPVSTVFGTNGSGKTTILNAVLWSLWDTLTEDFLLPEQLVNNLKFDSLSDGEKAEGYVEVKFEHAGSKFKVIRTQTETNRSGIGTQGTSQMKVEEIDASGEARSFINEVGFQKIDELFPKKLAKYFFFNGERFLSNVNSGIGQKEFGQAVRHVLGLTKFERALQHTKKAITDLEMSVADLDNDDDLKSLNNKKELNEEDISKHESDIVADETGISTLELRFKEIDESLKTFEEIKGFIQERVRLEADVIKLKKEIEKKTEALGSLISKQSATLFLSKYYREIIDLGNSHRRQKHIPAGFQESFVRDLLDSGVCICGEALKPGDSHYKKVLARLSEGSLTDTEEEWTLLDNAAKGIGFAVKEFIVQMKQIDEEREGLKVSLFTKRDLITGLETKIGASGIEIEKIQVLEEERVEVRRAWDNLLEKKGKDDAALSKCKKEGERLSSEIKNREPNNERAKLEHRRAQLLQHVYENIEIKLKELKAGLLLSIEASITSIFGRLSATSFFAKLSEDFVLTMYRYSKSHEEVKATMGTGDLQLSYYSFVAALSGYNFSQSQHSGVVVESFPMMIDAPFSSLDVPQIKRLIQELPKQTHQLILTMLNGHNEEMHSAEVQKINPKVAVATLYTNNNAIDEESIELPSSSVPVPYVVRTLDRQNYTELRQIL